MNSTAKSTPTLKDALRESISTLKTLRDEIRVEVHLGSMEVKDGWAKLEPRFAEAELLVAKGRQSSHQALVQIVDAFKAFRGTLPSRAEGTRT